MPNVQANCFLPSKIPPFAGALLSPDLHVEHSPLNDADVRVVQLSEDALCLLLKELKVKMHK